MNAQSGHATGGIADATNPATYAAATIDASGSTVTASDNKVSVGENSTVSGDIAGGLAEMTLTGGSATAGLANGVQSSADASMDVSNAQVQANNNEVTLNGSLQGGNLYGGAVTFAITPGTVTGDVSSHNEVNLTGSIAQSIHNTVTIGDAGKINSPTGGLYGGYLTYNAGYAPESYDVFTDNTLNYLSSSQSFVQKIGNFEHYNFALTPGYANSGTVLLSA